MKTVLLILAISTLVSCGDSSDGLVEAGSNNETQKLSYQINVNGCDTGKHTFSSEAEYCAGLRNDELNNFCATSVRRERYNANNCADLTGIDF